MVDRLHSTMRSGSFRLWLLLGLAGLGGIFPDIEKLWNGFQRGGWHSYIIGFVLLGIGILFILVGLVISYIRRRK